MVSKENYRIMDYSIQDRASLKQWEEFKVYLIIFSVHTTPTVLHVGQFFDGQGTILFFTSQNFCVSTTLSNSFIQCRLRSFCEFEQSLSSAPSKGFEF